MFATPPLWLRLDDGAEGDVDLGADLRGELFEPLRAPPFARVRVEHGTLVWPNGADWSSEALRECNRGKEKARVTID